MKKNNFIKALIFSFIVCLSFSCSKKCNNSNNSTCSEIVPTNELCAAYFERWFYNSSSNTCELKSYSGCSQKGFATQQDCEICKCMK